MLNQPVAEVGGSGEIEQGFRQRLQLIQRPAAAAKQTQAHLGFSLAKDLLVSPTLGEILNSDAAHGANLLSRKIVKL